MRILAIETSSSDVATAVADETGPVASAAVRSGRRHAELLHPLVLQVCDGAGVALGELDAIAVDVGPGLFTGIRVGVAAAKGFATALGVPVVALTSLEILRAACETVSPSTVVAVPVVDLRRGDVAWALPGEAMDFGPPDRLALLLDSIRASLVLAGDGALRYASILSGGRAEVGEGSPVAVEGAGRPERTTGRADGAREVAGAELGSPPVASLAVRAVAELRAGGGVDPLEVLPVYLREADARINWTTRHDAPGLVMPEAGAH